MAKVTSSSSLEGFEATRRAFAAAPELVKVAAQDVVAKSAFAVAQRAKALVPVRTGKLKAAIVSASTGLNGRIGVADKSVFYWRFVEFGTVKQSAHPFFRPAAEAESDAFVRAMAAIGPRLERDLSAGRLL